jgi:NADH-quinone oxidoreductase subunit M
MNPGAATTVFPALSALLILPLAGALVALALSRDAASGRRLALGVSLAELALILALPLLNGPGPLHVAEDFAWISAMGARYHLGLDGLSYVLVLLTAVLQVLAVLVSWREVERSVGFYFFCLLASQASANGIFLARDLFLFALFWEFQLVPMFLLIGVFGHEEKRAAAAKFLIFSLAGGLAMLLAIAGLGLAQAGSTGLPNFSLAALLAQPVPPGLQLWLFTGFLLAVAVKVPILPLHTWLPDAHTQAPTAGSLILAGVLLKTGAYALIRLALPLFPAAAQAALPVLMFVGLLGLFYASWIALAQTDAKRLVAYSSIGHMSLVVLGAAAGSPLSLTGSMLQMLGHALSTGGLFLMVGMLSERAGSRELADFGGLWRTMPVFGAFFLFLCLAAAGLPGLCNFPGEFMIIVGTFKDHPAAGAAAFAGLVLTLVYVLRLAAAVIFGRPGKKARHPDMTFREVLILSGLTALILLLGLHPQPVLDLLTPAVTELLGARGGLP